MGRGPEWCHVCNIPLLSKVVCSQGVGFFGVDIPTRTTHSTSPPIHTHCHHALGVVSSDFPDPGVNLIQDLLVLEKTAVPPWYAGTLSPK